MSESIDLPSADTVQKLIDQLQRSVAALDATRVTLEAENAALVERIAEREATMEKLQNRMVQTIQSTQEQESRLRSVIADATKAVQDQEMRSKRLVEDVDGRIGVEVARTRSKVDEMCASIEHNLKGIHDSASNVAREVIAPLSKSIRELDKRVAATHATVHTERHQRQAEQTRAIEVINTTFAKHTAHAEQMLSQINDLRTLLANQQRAIEDLEREQTKPLIRRKFF